MSIAVITNGVSCLSRFFLSELVTALTNVCGYCSPAGDAPTLISKVLVVTFDIWVNMPLTGSVERGYAWLEPLLSLVHVNVNAPSSNLTQSSFAKPWPERVMVTIPVDALYVALSGVYESTIALGWESGVWLPSDAHVNVTAPFANLICSPTYLAAAPVVPMSNIKSPVTVLYSVLEPGV